MSGLTAGQAKFTSVFSRETGLNPQVVGAWLLAEQSGAAAKNYEGKGYNNWLNIANTDSGQKGGSHSNVWKNPESAAKASAEWIRGRGQIAQEYGKPASSITAILGSHGEVPHRQIQAIANSGWASSGYEHGNTLSQLLGQVGNIPTAGPGPLPGVTRQGAIAGVTEQSTFNRQGYQEAARHAAGERAAASLFTGGGEGDSLLRQALEKAGTLPNAQQFGATRLVEGPNGPTTFRANSGPANALPGGRLDGFLPNGAPLEVKRKDQGQDIKTAPGGAILAPGNGVVKMVQSNPGGFGTAYPIVHFDTGPLAGHDVYIGHTRAALAAGARFRAGDVISHTGNGTGPYVGNATGLPGWAEIGLWEGGPIRGTSTGGQRIAPLLGLR